jgi:hypothetical protein
VGAVADRDRTANGKFRSQPRPKRTIGSATPTTTTDPLPTEAGPLGTISNGSYFDRRHPEELIASTAQLILDRIHANPAHNLWMAGRRTT